jgi:hypothetical protein
MLILPRKALISNTLHPSGTDGPFAALKPVLQLFLTAITVTRSFLWVNLFSGKMTTEQIERFERNFFINVWNGCFEWIACLDGRGYGTFWTNRGCGAHRIAFELYCGPIPSGLWVLHHCDNRKCVNPSHLFLGTQFDNMRDMVRKGRMNPDQLAGLERIRRLPKWRKLIRSRVR